jgi:hypothetical protein
MVLVRGPFPLEMLVVEALKMVQDIDKGSS